MIDTTLFPNQWFKPPLTQQAEPNAEMINLVHEGTIVLSNLRFKHSPFTISQWLIQTWTQLHNKQPPSQIYLFDVIWIAWATSPISNSAILEASGIDTPLSDNLPMHIVVTALSQYRSSRINPDQMPWQALVLLVDHKTSSPIRLLLVNPVLRPHPQMDSSRIPQNQQARSSPKKRTYNGTQRDNDLAPPIPLLVDPVIAYSFSAPVKITVTAMFSALLNLHQLDDVRDRILERVADPSVAAMLLRAFVVWTVSHSTGGKLDPVKYDKLTLAMSKYPSVYLRESTIPSLSKALIHTVPMSLLTCPILMPTLQQSQQFTPANIIQAYFSLPVKRNVSHSLLNDLKLSPQDLLLLMLALAHVNKEATKSIWIHHILIPVLDTLSLPLFTKSDRSWSILCHFLDTPVLACALLTQLRLRGPLFDALLSAVAPVSLTQFSRTIENSPECHGVSPSAVKLIDGLHLIKEWEKRWTDASTLLEFNVILDLAHVDFVTETHQPHCSSLQPLLQLQLNVLSAQVSGHTSNLGVNDNTHPTGGLIEDLICTLLLSPFPSGDLIAAVVKGINPGSFQSLANGLEQFCLNCMDTSSSMSHFVANLTSMNMRLEQETDVCPITCGILAMHFMSDRVFGLLLYQVFHLMPNDLACTYLTWLYKLLDYALHCLPTHTYPDVIKIHPNTVPAAVLYTAHADENVAKTVALVLEKSGLLVLCNLQQQLQRNAVAQSVETTAIITTIRIEMLAALMSSFFEEFDRLLVKREKTELINSVANQPLDLVTRLGRPLLPLDPTHLINVSVNPADIAASLHTSEGATMHATTQDWVLAQQVMASALDRAHARLDRLTQGYTLIAQSWHISNHNSANANVQEARIVTEVLTRMHMVGHSHNLAAVSQWRFPNPYLMHLLVRIELGPAFLKVAGVQLASELNMAGSTNDKETPEVPQPVVNDTFKAVYLMAADAFSISQDKNVLPFDYSLLVCLLASVLKVSESLYPLWHQMVSAVPIIQNVTRNMYAPLVQSVLLPVEQLSAHSLWWCTVEGIVRRKVPSPR